MYKYLFFIAVLTVLVLSAGNNIKPDDIPAYTTNNLYIQQQSITTESMNLEWAL